MSDLIIAGVMLAVAGLSLILGDWKTPRGGRK